MGESGAGAPGRARLRALSDDTAFPATVKDSLTTASGESPATSSRAANG
jgi:hypothetical protein